MQEDRKAAAKVKRRWIAVDVGLQDGEGCGGRDDEGSLRRFGIPIWFLYHPLFQGLLEKAREVYGYTTDGPLRLPCSVDDFIHVRCQIEKETLLRRRHSLSGALSFYSCC